MKRILDKDFEYVPAAKTDVRKTFAKERMRLKKENLKTQHVNPLEKVTQLRKESKA